jgi:hypothetical protein
VEEDAAAEEERGKDWFAAFGDPLRALPLGILRKYSF